MACGKWGKRGGCLGAWGVGVWTGKGTDKSIRTCLSKLPFSKLRFSLSSKTLRPCEGYNTRLNASVIHAQAALPLASNMTEAAVAIVLMSLGNVGLASTPSALISNLASSKDRAQALL